MEKIIYKAETRGHKNHGWLNTYHTFSFANYYDPERIHFGNLRVINDDIIAPYCGFGMHPHDNMEIITIVLDGELTHEDSMGHKQTIIANEVQVMSAGTGIFHSEFNHTDQPVSLLQVWIFPDVKNIVPTYKQYQFDGEKAKNKWQPLVNSDDTPLKIHQQAKVCRIFIEKGEMVEYHPEKISYGNYFFLVDGKVEVEGVELNRRDGLGLRTNAPVKVVASEKSYLINFEV